MEKKQKYLITYKHKQYTENEETTVIDIDTIHSTDMDSAYDEYMDQQEFLDIEIINIERVE